MNYDELLSLEPFGICQADKEQRLTKELIALTEYHREHCQEYRKILTVLNFNECSIRGLQDIPFFPVRLFKELELKSVKNEEIIKTMMSSGTTGQRVSKIFLDRDTAQNQQRTLVRIVTDFTGSTRLPMIIIDSSSAVKNRDAFSARRAGILGFSMFGRKTLYALDDSMNLKLDELRDFLRENASRRILLFGFTFLVWKYFYKPLEKLGEHLPMENAILIHGGGWKKLAQEAVTREEFRKRLQRVCGVGQICDYYGMVEQTGCVYMECEMGHLHASTYSDVFVRRGRDFSVAEIGEAGILQVLSVLPKSYPGHSLLTEDEAILLGVDDCPCGRKGKYFHVVGRIHQAEIRGCSDTYANAT